MTQVERVQRDIDKLPADLADGGVAGLALAMAAVLDGEARGSASECGKVLLQALAELRELAPPAEKKGQLHDLKSERAVRLAAGRSAA